MSIQSGINQSLSVASMLLTQNPALRAQGEKAAKIQDLNRKEKNIKERVSALSTQGEHLGYAIKRREGVELPREESDAIMAQMEAIGTAVDELRDEGIELAKERANIDPTDKNVKTYVDRLAEKGRVARSKKAVEEIFTKKAEADAAAEARVAERRAEVEKSRSFAKMITEGVSGLSFNPDEYEPPERKK